MSTVRESLLKANEWVVITGAGKGIGKAIALAFAKQAKQPLILISRSQQSLQQTHSLCQALTSQKIEIFQSDLSADHIEWPSLFKEIDVGLVINNAGQFSMNKASELDASDMLNDWRSNVLPSIHCNHFFMESLKKKKGGGLFHIVSAAALEGRSYAASYSSAKHALIGYVRSLREDMMQFGIAVTAIHPGQTFTASWDGSDVDPNELIDADDIAQLIVSLSNFSSRTVAEEIHLEPIKGDRAPY